MSVYIDHWYIRRWRDVVSGGEDAIGAADVPKALDILLSWCNESTTHQRILALTYCAAQTYQIPNLEGSTSGRRNHARKNGLQLSAKGCSSLLVGSCLKS